MRAAIFPLTLGLILLAACNGGLSDGASSGGSVTPGSTTLPPSAVFSAPIQRIGVAPFTVQFEQVDSARTNDWRWSYGDGAGCTAVLQNGTITGSCSPDPIRPTHTYTAPGVYTVSLRAKGPGGTRFEILENVIEVLEPPPVAEFTATNTSGIIPLTVQFTNGSTNAKDFVWNFGDGTTSTAVNPEKTYPEGVFGNFTVTLTALGPGGNAVVVKSNFVNAIAPAPFPEFTMTSGSTTGTVIDGQLPLSVTFTQTPDPAHPTFSYTTSRIWTFGDLNGNGVIDPSTEQSTAESPTFVYAGPGFFNVSLQATGPGGTRTSEAGKTVESYDLIADASFENTTAGQSPGPVIAATAPPVPGDVWRTFGGVLLGPPNHLVQSTSSATAELGVPSPPGTKWCVLDSITTLSATPPSPTTGAPETTLASGGAGIVQTFSYRGNATVLKFEPVFITENGATAEDDWLSVDVTHGAETRNVYFARAGTMTVLNSAGDSANFPGTQLTARPGTIAVNLASLFSGTSILSTFTLRAQVGNRFNSANPSRGYVDNFRLEIPGGVNAQFTSAGPTIVSTGSPNNFFARFTAGATGTPNMFQWDFGVGADPATLTTTSPIASCRYTSEGIKTVTLTASRVVGGMTVSSATTTVANAIRVYPQPTASFTRSVDCSQGLSTAVTLICDRAPVTVSLTNTSNNPGGTSFPNLAYKWRIDNVLENAGGTGITLDRTLTTGGTHTFRLRVETPSSLFDQSLNATGFAFEAAQQSEVLSAPASFSDVHTTLILANCQSCHGATGNAPTMVGVSAADLRTYFLTQTSCDAAHPSYVVTNGSLSASFLWRLVAVNTASSGTCASRRMPPGGISVNPEDKVDTLRSWISRGAP